MTEKGAHMAWRSSHGSVAARHEEILGQSPRIEPVSELTEDLLAVIAPPAGYEAKAGDVPLMYSMLLHNVGFLKCFKPMSSYFIQEGILAPRLRELAILRIAWLNQFPFIWGEHVEWAYRVGMTADEIERVTIGSAAEPWSALDQAVLAAVEELFANGIISDATWAQLAAELPDDALIEIPAVTGQYQTLGYLQNSLRLPLWETNPGLSAR